MIRKGKSDAVHKKIEGKYETKDEKIQNKKSRQNLMSSSDMMEKKQIRKM